MFSIGIRILRDTEDKMVLAEPVRITQYIARVLDSLSISYFVGGSLASSLHGVPRATQDVDIIADIKIKNIPELVDAFKQDYYIDPDMIQDAIKHRTSFNIIHLGTMFKADIFILKPDTLSQIEMKRRQQYQISDIPQQTLFLASAEDIIINKLYWFQLGGGVSERQWNDALGVIKIQSKNLDYQYLEHAASERRITDLFEKALKEIGIK